MGFLPPLEKGGEGRSPEREAREDLPGLSDAAGRAQCRERPCRMYGLDFWRSRTAQPKGEVRKRGDFLKVSLPLNFGYRDSGR